MLINNISNDLREKAIESGYNQNMIANKLHRSRQYICNIFNGGVFPVSKSIINIMELLGYDIQLTYVKREKKG